MELESQYTKSLNLKEEGNNFFRSKELTKALRKYYEALLSINSYLSSTNVGDFLPPQIAENYSKKSNNEKEEEILQEKYTVLKLAVVSNMCTIYMKQKKWDRVLKYGVDALEKNDPNHEKIRFKVATAYLSLDDFERCEVLVRSLLEDCPENEEVVNLAEKLKKKRDKADKALFSKMGKMFS